MGLKDFYHLLDNGDMKEALVVMESLEGDERLEAELTKATLDLNFYGGVHEISSLVKDLVKKTHHNSLLQSFARACLAFIFIWEAKYPEALAELDEAARLINENPTKSRYSVPVIFVSFIKAFYLVEVGKHDEAIAIYSHVIETALAQQFPLKIFGMAAFHNLGSIYEHKGECKRAIENYLKCMKIVEELGNKILLAYPLTKLGNLYHLQGNLTLATDMLEEGLENSRTFKDSRAAAWALEGLGAVYHSKGDFSLALRMYEDALETTKTAELKASDLTSTLYRLTVLYLDMDNPDMAKEYLRQLQNHATSDTSLHTKTMSLFAEGLILKSSKRFKDKARAQDLFQSIFEDKKKTQKIRFLAMLHFCDLLLQQSEDNMMLDKARKIAGELYEFARSSKFIPDQINALILQAKFALIEGDVNRALDLLEQAYNFANRKELTNLKHAVEEEQNSLRRDLNRWQNLLDINASLRERIKLSEIEEYLETAIKIRDRTLEIT
ncbi:MAG: tetratricopeptide repeat protein [Candidatus Thorarchaeota archaeon]